MTVRTVRAWPAGRDWCFAPGIWREMSRRRWDVVHVQSYHTLVAPLAMLRALPAGGPLRRHLPRRRAFLGGPQPGPRHSSDWLLAPLLRRAAKLIAVARFEIDAVRRRARRPGGAIRADPQRDRPRLRALAGRERKAGGPSHDRLDRAAGALQGPPPRARCASPRARAEPEARLLIVGTGPYESALREQADELGVATSVEFTSTPSDRPEAMAELLRTRLAGGPAQRVRDPSAGRARGRRRRPSSAGRRRERAGRDRRGRLRAIRGPLTSGPRGSHAPCIDALAEPPPSRRPTLMSWDDCAASLQALYQSVA